jgi:hypothetical protein
MMRRQLLLDQPNQTVAASTFGGSTYSIDSTVVVGMQNQRQGSFGLLNTESQLVMPEVQVFTSIMIPSSRWVWDK